MLYRPNFCCQCGEKIARARWTPWTSRRFCEFCEIEQKQHDLVPKVAAVIALLVGVGGATAYLMSDAPRVVEPTSSARVRALKSEPIKELPASPVANQAPVQPAAAADIKQPVPREKTSTEAVHYCGALTKKGTPCTRRVKTNGRCWQHTGQPVAIISPN